MGIGWINLPGGFAWRPKCRTGRSLAMRSAPPDGSVNPAKADNTLPAEGA